VRRLECRGPLDPAVEHGVLPIFNPINLPTPIRDAEEEKHIRLAPNRDCLHFPLYF